MSYAVLAGVPPVFGLYGAFVPVLVYALFGSSKQLGTGPVAVTSLLIASGVQAMVPGSASLDPSNPAASPQQAEAQDMYNAKVIQLAFLVSMLYTGVGLLRMGWLVRFLSHAVITGFTSGAAFIIAASQVKYILGYSVPRRDTLHENIQVLIENRGKFAWAEFVMGTAMILWLVGLRFLGKWRPKLFWLAALGPISACVISIVVVVAVGQKGGKGPIKIVGELFGCLLLLKRGAAGEDRAHLSSASTSLSTHPPQPVLALHPKPNPLRTAQARSPPASPR